jgi:small GTP-binding protein
MGNFLRRLFMSTSAPTEYRVVMIGLDNAGKTTILYKLKLDTVAQTAPTLGFNMETVQIESLNLVIWDIAGQERFRPVWNHYLLNTKAIIYVVDANDRERIDLALEELWRVIEQPEHCETPLLVLANKQDLYGAMSSREVAERLMLKRLRHSNWTVQGTSALRKDGLVEGFQWLSEVLKRAR